MASWSPASRRRRGPVALRPRLLPGVPCRGVYDYLRGGIEGVKQGSCSRTVSYPVWLLAASSLPRHSEPAHRHEKGGARYCDRWQQLVSLAVRGVVVWFRRRRKHLASPAARLARVRPEHASRYPRLRPERWIPIRQLLRRSRLDPANLRKVTEHFEFRGGLPPRNPACRFLRQRCDDTPPT